MNHVPVELLDAGPRMLGWPELLVPMLLVALVAISAALTAYVVWGAR